MRQLAGKNIVVIGGSRGVGRRIVEASAGNGARVLAVARQEGALRRLAEEVSGVDILSCDARSEEAPKQVFDVRHPDVLVIGGGVFPPTGPFHELSWQDFAVNWEADVRIAFNFCKAALAHPLPAGTTVILIASGAGLAGSPNSGGYAGAKRTQMFLSNYSQKESDRLGLGLRFKALAPRMMPDTDLGKHAVAGYARYLGISEADFLRGMVAPPTAFDVADAVMRLIVETDGLPENAFIVSGRGLEAVQG